MSQPRGGSGCIGSSQLAPGLSLEKRCRRREVNLEEMTNQHAEIVDFDEDIAELVGDVGGAKYTFEPIVSLGGRIHSMKFTSWRASEVRTKWGEFGGFCKSI
ncbi:unnamed protein product [Rodentolepis nana]|uniref:Protein kinase domain-containing protein n=1 Tax=Rodentolepis nana TaxID=102285 RepID=A0A0R3TQI0_RODNA|nr:unnamed protein product [Rodentolepis nana]